MNTFLHLVAEDLYNRLKADMSTTVIVFPNRRAQHFFNEHLAAIATTPIFSPDYRSIGDLLRSMTPLQVADDIQLVVELYKVYCRVCHTTETIDEFFPYGARILSDFDDVDKWLVDPDVIYTNLSEMRRMASDLSYLTADQRQAMTTFFDNFHSGGTTDLKTRFAQIWNHLSTIYHEYKTTLSAQGIAYEGMLFREVISTIDLDALQYKTYVFVGFNVLTPVEQKLFSLLYKSNRAIFYHDYDNFYLSHPTHEAGKYLKNNLLRYPSPLGKEHFNNFAKKKNIQFVEATTDNAQARYLTQWLRNNTTTNERDTAIVLCNEELLLPVMHAIPENVSEVNVTMGFPVTQTTAYTLIQQLLTAHTQAYNASRQTFRLTKILPLLNNPFTQRIAPRASAIAAELVRKNHFYPSLQELLVDDDVRLLLQPVTTNEELCQRLLTVITAVAHSFTATSVTHTGTDAIESIHKEALFAIYTTVNKFALLLNDETVRQLSLTTFAELIVSNLLTAHVAFYGQPVQGIQVMGVIETRNLDFTNVILLSTNEGSLPKNTSSDSLIPYSLRKAFEMNTPEHLVSIDAYYFYRLIQRATNITLVYNSSTEGMHRGEYSRFMLQLLLESQQPITRLQLRATHQPQDNAPITINKSPEIMARLRKLYDTTNERHSRLSPTAINTYIDCSLRFYFNYLARLTSAGEVDEEVDAAHFGSIFHKVAEQLMLSLRDDNNLITPQQLDTVLLPDDNTIDTLLDDAFKECFFNVKPDAKVTYNGLQLITKKVIRRYIENLVRYDRRHAPFTFISAEERVATRLDIDRDDLMTIEIGGIIDRIDSLEAGITRIVDYKTGGQSAEPKGVDDLFTQQDGRAKYVLQIFIYAMIYQEQHPETSISPQIFYANRASKDDYEPTVVMNKSAIKELSQETITTFRQKLTTFLKDELFNPDVPFTQTTATNTCQYCPFHNLCHITIQ